MSFYLPPGDTTSVFPEENRGSVAVASVAAPNSRFPVGLLPDRLARFSVETAEAIGVDSAMVAPATLAACGAAIGTSRAVELKAGWHEFPIVWLALIAPSGSVKSAALDAALRPLRDVDGELYRQYADAMVDYQTARREWDATPKKRRGDPPREPTCKRRVVADVTVEALAMILADNPRGVLVARDELSGWIRSFNQYRSGGADVPAWLELNRGGALLVDRKGGDKRTVRVQNAAASIVGTVQPATFENLLTPEYRECGLAARLLIVRPEPRPALWTDRTPSADVLSRYDQCVRELAELEHVDTDRGPIPKLLPLTPAGRDAWRGWHNANALRVYKADGDALGAAVAKLRGYAARFALIFTLVDDPHDVAVDAPAVRRGCALADWFERQARHLYASLTETPTERERRELVQYVRDQGGSVAPRDLTRGPRRFRVPGGDVLAEAALQKLVRDGFGVWVGNRPTEAGGRPGRVFRLFESGDGDTTPVFPEEYRGSVATGGADE